jgi:mRNA deadenylase 3'-5' endonuclease subunit Ccr4
MQKFSKSSIPPPEAFMTRNLGIFAALRLKGNSEVFSVASTHLHWNPTLEIVKGAQALALLQCATEFSNSFGPSGPLIIAGDFNALPHSLAHSIMAKGINSPSSAPMVSDWDTMACSIFDSERPEAGTRSWLERLSLLLKQELRSSLGIDIEHFPPMEASGHRVAFESTYELASEAANATTYTHTFSGCIDYIYVRKMDHIRVESVLALPTFESLGGPCPNSKEPSDHLPLAATLSWGTEFSGEASGNALS